MCGVTGIFGADEYPVAAALERMSTAVAHRGPDDAGEEIIALPGAVVGLGHRRLAILDLSPNGHQPMRDPVTGSWISYNGETYNLDDLRRELEGHGYKFRSRTDTEVVLAAYGKWGLKALARLRGMFALSLWDESSKRLILARDPFGIKPLYYCRMGDLFLFASEVRALLASGLVPRRLSFDGLASYLLYGSFQAPATVIEGARSLLPGHYMAVERRDGKLQVEEGSYGPDLLSMESLGLSVPERDEAVALLREALEESIQLHLVSDVPLGVFLSGGIDSSALIALIKQVTRDRPKTFSVVFAEKEFSEAPHGRLVAERYGTEHREIALSERALLEMLPASLCAMDQPTMDGINTYVISKAVGENGIKVALSGLGGDELFAGYATFYRAHRAKRIVKVPARARRSLAFAGRRFLNHSVKQRKFWDILDGDGSPLSVYSLSRELFSPGQVNVLMRGKTPPTDLLMPARLPVEDPVNAMSLHELQGYMANTLLRDTDCMSMAHSLEVRVPFVDAAVISYVLRLPGAWKLDGRRPKPLLLDALGDLLPEEVWRRPKMGFTLPFERWMHGALAEEIDEALSNNGASLSAMGLDSSGVQLVWHKFQVDPAAVGWSRPWALYVLAKWCELNQVTM